jgi:hypothetical protein
LNAEFQKSVMTDERDITAFDKSGERRRGNWSVRRLHLKQGAIEWGRRRSLQGQAVRDILRREVHFVSSASIVLFEMKFDGQRIRTQGGICEYSGCAGIDCGEEASRVCGELSQVAQLGGGH